MTLSTPPFVLSVFPLPHPPRRTVQDKMTGADVKLTDEQVELVNRLQRGQFGDVNFNPYEVSKWLLLPPFSRGATVEGDSSAFLLLQPPPQPLTPLQPAVDFFSSQVRIHPVTNRPADKRSFIPSLVEKEKVSC